MKTLILTASGVEDCELFYPYYRFQEEGWEIDVASPDGEKILGEHGYSLEANLATESKVSLARGPDPLRRSG